MSFTYDDVRQALCISLRSTNGDDVQEYWYEGVVKWLEMRYITRRRSKIEVGKGGCTSAQKEGEWGLT